jgi:Fe2+ or Zn2+ uptake regulation protein
MIAVNHIQPRIPSKDLLNSVGLRNTQQRELILEIIRKGKGHMDADDVYQTARKKNPRLSLSTVYRTLQTLKELGLIEELHLDETHHHYEIKDSRDHHHFVCLKCGKVVEFETAAAARMMREVSREKGFEIINTEIRMTGYCADCKKSIDTPEKIKIENRE